MYKPLNMITKQTDELRQLISEHPDYPIVVLCNSEVCSDDSYDWWYAPSLHFSIGEILDCEQDINDERIYTDSAEFEEDLANKLADSGDYDVIPDEEFDAIVKAKIAKYKPYWKKVIQIRADI